MAVDVPADGRYIHHVGNATDTTDNARGFRMIREVKPIFNDDEQGMRDAVRAGLRAAGYEVSVDVSPDLAVRLSTGDLGHVHVWRFGAYVHCGGEEPNLAQDGASAAIYVVTVKALAGYLTAGK